MNANVWLRRLSGVLLIVLLPITACDDDDGAGPSGGPLPGLQFSFAGDSSGAYQSEGRVPAISTNGLPAFGSWAVARPDSLGGLVIAGFDGSEPSEDEVGDVFILQLNDVREGVFEPCGILADGGCHGRFLVGVVLADLATVEDAFEISDGQVEILEASDSRIRGSFEATFTSADGTRTISISDGLIDVPFSSDPFVSNGISCLARNLQAGTNEPCGQ